MFSFFRRRSKLEEREDLFLAALDRIVDAQTRQVEANANAIKAVVDLLRDQMSAWKVVGDPESWPLDDAAALAAERKRLEEAGVPANLDPVDQLRWVLDQSGR